VIKAYFVDFKSGGGLQAHSNLKFRAVAPRLTSGRKKFKVHTGNRRFFTHRLGNREIFLLSISA
jgi:hypothetical protein